MSKDYGVSINNDEHLELLRAFDDCVEAATPANTSKTAKGAVKRFLESPHGGTLPTTTANIKVYLAAHRKTHKVTTLRTWLWGIGEWHASLGLPDPAQNKEIKQFLKGLLKLEATANIPKQALPLSVNQLYKLELHLNNIMLNADKPIDRSLATRDRCLFMLAWWFGLRASSVTTIPKEGCIKLQDKTYDVHIPNFKDDKSNVGRIKHYSTTTSLDAVGALEDWLHLHNNHEGEALFYGVDRWGNPLKGCLTTRSVTNILKNRLNEIGEETHGISSHSFRHGYATWAAGHMDVVRLADRVGWSIKTAARYIITVEDQAIAHKAILQLEKEVVTNLAITA